MRLWLQDLAETPIEEITLFDIVDAWEAIRRFPKNCKPELIEDVWELIKSGEPPENAIGYQNAKKYKQELRKFFTWACELTGHATNNPISTDNSYKLLKDDRSKQIPRSKFSSQQSLIIIKHCKSHLGNPFSWAVLLMAYHGMRNGEVINLSKNDIVTDPESQICYINVKSGKTANAKRKIPVHSEVLKLGFIEYVQKFDSLIFNFNSAKLTNFYSYEFRGELNIPEFSEDGSRLSLYSFRHTVISK